MCSIRHTLAIKTKCQSQYLLEECIYEDQLINELWSTSSKAGVKIYILGLADGTKLQTGLAPQKLVMNNLPSFII